MKIKTKGNNTKQLKIVIFAIGLLIILFNPVKAFAETYDSV